MNKARTIVLAIGIAIGLAAGAYLVKSYYGVFDSLADFVAPGAYGDFVANIQYHHANPAKAEEALQNYAKFLQELDTVQPDRVKETDIGLSYGRISLIEEAAGNKQKANEYLAAAREYFRKAGYEKWTSTEDDARAFVAFWDGRGKLPPKR